MVETVTLEAYKQAYRELIMGENRAGFYIHFAVYVAVNAMLIAINLYYVPSVLWFIWPLGGWGIGVVAHYLGAVRYGSVGLERKEAQAEYRARTHATPIPQ